MDAELDVVDAEIIGEEVAAVAVVEDRRPVAPTVARGTSALAVWDGQVAVEGLSQEAIELLNASGRDGTRYSYALAWQNFAEWCAKNGRSPRLPTPEADLVSYVAYRIRLDLAPTTIKGDVAAILKKNLRANHAGLNPDRAYELITDHRHRRAEAGRGGKKSSAPVHQERLVAMLDAADDQPRAEAVARDRVAFLLAYFTRARASELCAYKVGDFELNAEGLLTVLKRTGKNDKGDTGTEYDIDDPTTIAAYLAWMDVLKERGEAGADRPFLRAFTASGSFRRPGKTGYGLTRVSVNELVKATARRAGIVTDTNNVRVTAHGLRAGMPTQAAVIGETFNDITDLFSDDWASPEVLRNYVKTGRRMNGQRADEGRRVQVMKKLNLS